MQQMLVLQARRQSGSVLVVAVMVMFLLSFLGLTLLTLAATENSVALNSLWTEGALVSAEAGIDHAMQQLSANPDTSVTAIPNTAMSPVYNYRSGPRTSSSPQPFQYKGTSAEAGYNLAVGTGYNQQGYAFHNYQLNVTGTGPKALREVEVLAEYGPVAQ